MRVHSNQVNPNAQLDAMYAAQKAAAKREAERTRKKLLEFGSKEAGEVDGEACVVELREREEAERKQQAKEQDQPKARARKSEAESVESPAAGNAISDWG
jgi:hypothetical protein